MPGFATSSNVLQFDISYLVGKKEIHQYRQMVDSILSPKSCPIDCELSYGDLLGQTSEGVVAYANDSSISITQEPCRVDNIVTGLPWECVEFARRWLLQTQDLIFADIPLATNMWNGINYLIQVSDGKTVALDSHPNGSHSKPQIGDLLTYSEAFLGTGHVAIVVGSDSEAGVIRVAEQNYSNCSWPANYSREIPLLEMDGRWWILDPYLTGWKGKH
jgi:hypothetical protein